MTNPVFDIAVPYETVTIAGVEHKVSGVPFRVVVALAKENPAFLTLLFGGGLDGEALLAKGPETLSTLLAWGLGDGENEQLRTKAGNLPLSVQLDLLAGTLKATIGGGSGPFVQKLTALKKIVELDQPKVFRVKAAEMSSPKPSPSSAPTTDGQQKKFGT